MKRAGAARLRELAVQYGLDELQLTSLERVLAVLAADPTASTTVRDPERAVDIHVADSLCGLVVPALREARLIADLGAGPGFPAAVLAIALPDARVVAVESVTRKCKWIRILAAEVQISNLEVACERAESWSSGREACDVVTARAVAPLGVLCEYAAPLLRVGGTLVAWKGVVDDEELRGSERAAERLGFSPLPDIPVAPFPGSRDHRLSCFVKKDPTPAGFPRRPGMATKRPL